MHAFFFNFLFFNKGCITMQRNLQFLPLVLLSVLHSALSAGYWDSSGNFYGNLDVQVTQVINGCDIAAVGYVPLVSDTKAAADSVLMGAIAGTAGLSMGSITNFLVTADTSSSVSISYHMSAVDVTSYAHVSRQFTQEIADGTFNNLLRLFEQSVADTPICLSGATAGAFSMVSEVPTNAPTAAPTMAPTSFDADHVSFLLEKWVVVSSIVGGVLCLLTLYYGYHLVLYIWNWLKERTDRHEREHTREVDNANRRLNERFTKADADRSPHTSQMRQNFKKQFGSLPLGDTDDDYGADYDSGAKGSSAATSSDASVGSSGAGKLVRTLVTKLPRSAGSPSRAGRPLSQSGQRGNAPGDEETDQAKMASFETTGSAPRSPDRQALSREVDYSIPGYEKKERSNRLAEKGGKGAFGFAAGSK